MEHPVEADGYLIERDLLTALAWYADEFRKQAAKDEEGPDA